MTSRAHGLKRLAGTICLCVAAGLVIAVCSAGTAAAQVNTMYGPGALANDTSGADDSAFGTDALYVNKTGNDNTAIGILALFNFAASGNTAIGSYALFGAYGATGGQNTATGWGSLMSDSTGYDNVATGAKALYLNTTGIYNTALGTYALYANNLGSYNTALGLNALRFNTSGNDNIALGYKAGFNVTGSNNIDIGHQGIAVESGIIRIGTAGQQTGAFIAGIAGRNITGAEVVVNSIGQLGVVVSSARFKRDIRDMDDSSSKLMKLRPVTFIYKGDQTGTIQYGLVAEEVARVYPELVTHGADGKVETVRYSELTGMLLNELQRQTRQVSAAQAEIVALKAGLKRERAQRAAFEAHITALVQTIQASNTGRKLAAAFDR